MINVTQSHILDWALNHFIISIGDGYSFFKGYKRCFNMSFWSGHSITLLFFSLNHFSMQHKGSFAVFSWEGSPVDTEVRSLWKHCPRRTLVKSLVLSLSFFSFITFSFPSFLAWVFQSFSDTQIRRSWSGVKSKVVFLWLVLADGMERRPRVQMMMLPKSNQIFREWNSFNTMLIFF